MVHIGIAAAIIFLCSLVYIIAQGDRYRSKHLRGKDCIIAGLFLMFVAEGIYWIIKFFLINSD